MSRSFVAVIALLAGACQPVPDLLVPFLREGVDPPHASQDAATDVAGRLDDDGEHGPDRWAEAAALYQDALHEEVAARVDVALEERGWGMADAGTVIDGAVVEALAYAAAQAQPRDNEEGAGLVDAALGLSFHHAVRLHLAERTRLGFDAAFGYGGLGFDGLPTYGLSKVVQWQDPASLDAYVEAFHAVHDALAVGTVGNVDALAVDAIYDEAAERIDAILVRAQLLDGAIALDDVASSPAATARLVVARVRWEAGRPPIGVLDGQLAARIDGLLYPGGLPDRTDPAFWLDGLDAIAAGDVGTNGGPAAEALRAAVDALGDELP